MNYTADVDIDIDVSDMMFAMSNEEKQEMLISLLEEGFMPDSKSMEDSGLKNTHIFQAEYSIEEELIDVLKEIWADRHLMTSQTINELRKTYKEKYGY